MTRSGVGPQSGVRKCLRRGFAKARPVVAGELAEVGIAGRRGCLRYGARAATAALDQDFPGEVETAIYRIVQESLTNVVKHARAQRVSVLLTRADGRIKAVIEDDGTGFDPAATDGGIGLVGMRERIELLDGTLTVEPTVLLCGIFTGATRCRRERTTTPPNISPSSITVLRDP